ncbi:MAG: YeeE/YedE thiosulfate transporter family protein, partial [Litorivicinaceae bacterium]|nr:YeeE/YedE thiosulfate transporter family protein [Litorivicinaceae bacterium]
RLVVLSGSGNLRAWFGLFVIGLSAYATFKGLMAETRVQWQQIGALQLPTESILLLVPSLAWVAIAGVTGVIGVFAFRHGLNRHLVGGLLVGLLVAGSWSMTSVLGADDFDPMAPVSLSFVAPIGEAMTYLQLASGLEPTFNVTLILGVLVGAFLSSIVRGEFQWQTFESAADHARYFLGAMMMGVGGILALGCNTGQAITGLATGSLWSLLVTLVIFMSGYLMHRRLLHSN